MTGFRDGSVAYSVARSPTNDITLYPLLGSNQRPSV